jgi:hypothetical protein
VNGQPIGPVLAVKKAMSSAAQSQRAWGRG